MYILEYSEILMIPVNNSYSCYCIYCKKKMDGEDIFEFHESCLIEVREFNEDKDKNYFNFALLQKEDPNLFSKMTIEDLRRVVRLYKNNRKLNNLSNSISCLKSLRVLYLQDNKLQTLPDGIKKLNNLFHLNLSNNKFNKIPDVVFFSKKLNTLILKNNNLKKIPKTINNLINLEYLYINDNFISYLPKEINQLFKLKFLNLEKNRLVGIPRITNLKSLRYINLNNNKFKSIPLELQFIPLKTLNIGTNKITKIEPKFFTSNKNLESLFIKNCNLTEIPFEISETKCKFLDISNNNICLLPDSLSQHISLLTMDISNNPIIKLPENIFFHHYEKFVAKNTELKTLPDISAPINEINLRGSPIEELPNIMSFEKGFHTLDITDTNITRISELIGKIPFEKVFISDKKLKNFFKNTKTKVYVNQRPIFDKKSHKCK